MSGADAPAPRVAIGPGAHLLVTGGAGFIGSCFVRDILARHDGTRITMVKYLKPA